MYPRAERTSSPWIFTVTVRFTAGKLRFQIPCLRPHSQQVAVGVSLQTQVPGRFGQSVHRMKEPKGGRTWGWNTASSDGRWHWLAPQRIHVSRNFVCVGGSPGLCGVVWFDSKKLKLKKKFCRRPNVGAFPQGYFLPGHLQPLLSGGELSSSQHSEQSLLGGGGAVYFSRLEADVYQSWDTSLVSDLLSNNFISRKAGEEWGPPLLQSKTEEDSVTSHGTTHPPAGQPPSEGHSWVPRPDNPRGPAES